jgi:Tol biopolymer transport system component
MAFEIPESRPLYLREAAIMKMFLAGIALAGALALSAAPGAPEKPKLLYASNRTGHVDIFLINADGTSPKSLTDSPSVDAYPAWSPDGKKIAFASDREGVFAIYVMDADGSNVKKLTSDNLMDRYPTWSPDGQKIAFSRMLTPSNQEIFVIDADGSNPTNLTNNSAHDASAAWSPDGKKIAFTSSRAGPGFRVYVMDADGKNVQDVSKADTAYAYLCPAWSPDGKKLAFSEGGGNEAEIYACDADGNNKKQLTSLGAQNTQCAWSPDGKKIAFQHFEPGDDAGSLYLMDVDGKNPTEILKAEGPLEGGKPAWKPK